MWREDDRHATSDGRTDVTERPRLAPLAPAERTDEQKAIIDSLDNKLNIFTTFVRNPALFTAYAKFAGRLLYRSGLPPTVREILILRTAYRCRSAYEWVHHVEIGTQEGVPADVIAALRTERPTGIDANTALLVSAADELAANHELTDETWTGLRGIFDEQQMIEICMLVGNYVMTAGVLKSLRVPLEDGYTAPDW
jgi:4-carboxymuconolactone decarboxylase